MISVCIASFNGAKYIKEQIVSILNQIGTDDEVIIVDDCSKDNSIEILKSFDDKRLKIYLNEKNMGHVYTFGRAISLTTKDYIFLADQDDIWLEKRLITIMKNLKETEVMLVSSNYSLINANGDELPPPISKLHSKDSFNYWGNIRGIFMGTRPYFGCAMAFKDNIKDIILPIPSYIESHDLWIAMVCNYLKSNIHIDDYTLARRLHGNNLTPTSKRSLLKKLKSRVIFAISLFEIVKRRKRIVE